MARVNASVKAHKGQKLENSHISATRPPIKIRSTFLLFNFWFYLPKMSKKLGFMAQNGCFSTFHQRQALTLSHKFNHCFGRWSRHVICQVLQSLSRHGKSHESLIWKASWYKQYQLLYLQRPRLVWMEQLSSTLLHLKHQGAVSSATWCPHPTSMSENLSLLQQASSQHQASKI